MKKIKVRLETMTDRECWGNNKYDSWSVYLIYPSEIRGKLYDFLSSYNLGKFIGCPNDETDNWSWEIEGDAWIIERGNLDCQNKAEWVKNVRKAVKEFNKGIK